MDHQKYPQFTKYEIARILGARALQIAMDAPVLLKISEADLKAIKYSDIEWVAIEHYIKLRKLRR